MGQNCPSAAPKLCRVGLSPLTDIRLTAEIPPYSRTKGVFAGVSLDGAVAQADKGGDPAIYGDDVNRHEILSGKVAAPASALELLHEIGGELREVEAKP
jgi:lipid-binding SYLF domain-containing protein